jgi:hypothetical protein
VATPASDAVACDEDSRCIVCSRCFVATEATSGCSDGEKGEAKDAASAQKSRELSATMRAQTV